MTPSLSVFVQCPQVLRPGFEVCRAAIEESDIGKDYTLVMQQPGVGVFEHFLSMLDQMADASTDLVVRFEDDVDVNRHFVHNVVTWPALHSERFGLGWLFDPGGATYTTHDKMYGRPPSREFVPAGQFAYSLAVVMWRRDVAAIRKSCARWDARMGGNAQDLALSEAPWSFGKDTIVHAPSLTEHLINLPSTLKHFHNMYATSMGSFFKEWQRGAPRYDQYGRVVGVQ